MQLNEMNMYLMIALRMIMTQWESSGWKWKKSSRKEFYSNHKKKEGSEENKILQYPEFPLVVFLNHFPLIGFFIAISVALGKYIHYHYCHFFEMGQEILWKTIWMSVWGKRNEEIGKLGENSVRLITQGISELDKWKDEKWPRIWFNFPRQYLNLIW